MQKFSVFVNIAEAVIHLLSYNLYNCAFNVIFAAMRFPM